MNPSIKGRIYKKKKNDELSGTKTMMDRTASILLDIASLGNTLSEEVYGFALLRKETSTGLTWLPIL